MFSLVCYTCFAWLKHWKSYNCELLLITSPLVSDSLSVTLHYCYWPKGRTFGSTYWKIDLIITAIVFGFCRRHSLFKIFTINLTSGCGCCLSATISRIILIKVVFVIKAYYFSKGNSSVWKSNLKNGKFKE